MVDLLHDNEVDLMDDDKIRRRCEANFGKAPAPAMSVPMTLSRADVVVSDTVVRHTLTLAAGAHSVAHSNQVSRLLLVSDCASAGNVLLKETPL